MSSINVARNEVFHSLSGCFKRKKPICRTTNGNMDVKSSTHEETVTHTKGDASTASMKQLRAAIPNHCFKASNAKSLAYIVQDSLIAAVLAFAAYHLALQSDNWWTKCVTWAAYGFMQGLIMTGVWVLAHECGHQALFTSSVANDFFGFVLHSILLVPYFSWKYSHGLHHRYTNHMEKDTVFVPARDLERKTVSEWLQRFEVAEDAPAVNLLLLLMHQLLGFPGYLFFNVSAGAKSLQRSERGSSKRQSHFDPQSDVFTAKQHPFILLSDLGLIAVLAGVYLLGTKIGHWTTFLLYFVPYLWVNHWIGEYYAFTIHFVDIWLGANSPAMSRLRRRMEGEERKMRTTKLEEGADKGLTRCSGHHLPPSHSSASGTLRGTDMELSRWSSGNRRQRFWLRWETPLPRNH